jgi:hypothetical protein
MALFGTDSTRPCQQALNVFKRALRYIQRYGSTLMIAKTYRGFRLYKRRPMTAAESKTPQGYGHLRTSGLLVIVEYLRFS